MACTPRRCFGTALHRLDLLLHREILRLRARYQLSLDEFRGLYISDSHVDSLVRDWVETDQAQFDISTLTQEAQAIESEAREALADDPLWRHVSQEFSLSDFEQDALLLALAPELHPKYETLYAYLNNDVTRKFPTVDLALRLFSDGQDERIRQALSPSGQLLAAHLLEFDEDSRLSLGSCFNIAPALSHHLLGLFPSDRKLLFRVNYFPAVSAAPSIDSLDESLQRQLQVVSCVCASDGAKPVFVLEGERGAGRLKAVQAALSRANKSLFSTDLSAMALKDRPPLEQADRLLLLARLCDAGLYLVGLDVLMDGDNRDRLIVSALLGQLKAASTPVFVPLQRNAPWRRWLGGAPALHIDFPEPSPNRRRRLWIQSLRSRSIAAAAKHVSEVADRFVLNAGQIEACAAAVALEHQQASGVRRKVPQQALFKAAREQSAGEIGRLAQKDRLTYRREDLVLPPTTLQRVNEIVGAIRNRGLVYREWDMQRRFGGASGLMILFSGASGTGKTMTASVMASEVGLDLYRIDLSGVVSKYIGETEKNLDRIFSAARRANCILFFDEADALFGKRSEVKDAHDRYANIEVAYLLQKMEDHDGVVILCTNIPKNLDQAFSRRMHYALDFPRPGPDHRERLWRGMFPGRTPLAADVDFGFLARQFDSTGGDIRNVALEAAMLAASRGGAIDMNCLINAMARQMVKRGKVPSPTDFKQFFAMIQ